MSETPRRRKRSGGRAGNVRRDSGNVIEQMPWRILTNTDRPTEPLDDAGVAAIHDGAMRILEEIGIEFLLYQVLHEPFDKRPGNDPATAEHDEAFDAKPHGQDRRGEKRNDKR